MRRTILLCVVVAFVASLQAQSFEDFKKRSQENFDKFKAQKEQEFNDFREKSNAEFAEFMRKAWTRKDAKPAEPIPALPEPPEPVVKDPDKEKTSNPITPDNVTPPVAPVPQPEPVVPIVPEPVEPTEPEPTKPEPVAPQPQPQPKHQPSQPVPTTPIAPTPKPEPVAPKPTKPQPTKPVEPMFTFVFYGTPCQVPLSDDMRFRLSGVDENSVADVWTKLSKQKYLNMVAACLSLRSSLSLNDWGYICLAEELSLAWCGKQNINEARVMQMFILVQSGYKVRIARSNDRLYLLMASIDEIYQHSYLILNGENYYFIERDTRAQSIYVFDQTFPGEQSFSLGPNKVPNFKNKATAARTITSGRRFPGTSATVSTNQNLIDFYNTFPPTSAWNNYAATGLSTEAKRQLYAPLRQAIAKKTLAEAADFLLNFVQTAFEYQTDDEQFGVERPLFGDETLYYPYCDCEDRSILYANLVHDLLHLDVVLLHFPGHLATAVNFKQSLNGDYMMLDDKRYLICDPTYIGASIGECMPHLKNSKVDVQKINWNK